MSEKPERIDIPLLRWIGLVLLFFFTCGLYWSNFEDPRSYQRTIAYALGAVGILMSLVNFGIGLSVEGIPHSEKRTSQIFAGILLLLPLSFIYHYTNVTWEFRNTFFLGERDFTSMAEVINNIRKYGIFFSPFHGDENPSYLAHHFSPGLVFFAPFLGLADTRIGLALGHLFYSVILYAIGFSTLWWGRTKPNRDEIVLWLVFWGGNLYLYRMALSYHFEILFVVFFLALAWARYHSRIGWEAVFFVLVLSVKEDASIYLAIFYFSEMVYLLIRRRGNTREFGFFILAFLSYTVIIPTIRSWMGVEATENWTSIWGNWGETPREILVNILTSPDRILELFYAKKGTAWELLLGFGCLIVLAPRYWIYILTILAIHFLSDREWHNSFYNYYIYPLLPVLVLATKEGWEKVNAIAGSKASTILFTLVLALVFFRNSWDKNFPFPSPLQISHQTTNSQNSYQFTTTRDSYQSSGIHNHAGSIDSIDSVEKIVIKIPDGARVASQFDLGIFLPVSVDLYPLREDLGTLPLNPIHRKKNLPNEPEYILTNSRSGFSPYVSLETIAEWEKKWIQTNRYKILARSGDYTLYQRTD